MSVSKRIVITGVSRGLGRAMTDQFISLGHTVAGCARSETAIADLSKQYESPNRFDVIDITSPDQIESWATSVSQSFGIPDYLINCAAIINRNSPLWDVQPSEFSDVVDINIKGVHNVICAYVPFMIERGAGVIINFSSYWGRSTSPDVAPYCATKWAIEGLSRGLANDLPTGLASIAFNPGIIHTDMLDSCFAEGASSYPSPSQWANQAVPYILSLGAGDNGQSVTVPGF